LGIDSKTQRIGRTGQEVYQTLMRLSLREPRATHDITLVNRTGFVGGSNS
jgi:hypothetical protein